MLQQGATSQTAPVQQPTFGFSPLSFPPREMLAGFVVDYYAAVAIANLNSEGVTVLDEKSVIDKTTAKLNGALTFFKQELNLTIIPHVTIGSVQLADRLRASATRGTAMIDEISTEISKLTFPGIAAGDLQFAIYLTPSFDLLGISKSPDGKETLGCVPAMQNLNWLWNKHFRKVPSWTARRAGACNGTRTLLPPESIYNNGFIGQSRFGAVASLYPSNFSMIGSDEIYPREKKYACDPLGAKSSLTILKTVGTLLGMREIVPSITSSPGQPSWSNTDRTSDMAFTVPGNLITSQFKASQLPNDIWFGETGYSTLMGQFNKQRGTLHPINRNDYRAFQNPASRWNGCGKLLGDAPTGTILPLATYNNKVPLGTPFFIDVPLSDEKSSYMISYVSPSNTTNESTFRSITPDLSRHRLTGSKNTLYDLQSFKFAMPDVLQPMTKYQREIPGMPLDLNLSIISDQCSARNEFRIFGALLGPSTICEPSSEHRFLVEQLMDDGRVNRQTVTISMVNQGDPYGLYANNSKIGNQTPYGRALSVDQEYTLPMTPLTDANLASELAGGDVFFIPEGVMLSSKVPVIDPNGYGDYDGDFVSNKTLIEQLVTKMETYRTAGSSVTADPQTLYWPKDVLGFISHIRNPLLFANEGRYEGMYPSRLPLRESLSYSYIEQLILSEGDAYRVGSFRGNASSVKVRIPRSIFNRVSPAYTETIRNHYQNFDLATALAGKGFFILIPRPVTGKAPFRFYSRSDRYFAVVGVSATPTPQPSTTPQSTPTAAATATPYPTATPDIAESNVKFVTVKVNGLSTYDPYTTNQHRRDGFYNYFNDTNVSPVRCIASQNLFSQWIASANPRSCTSSDTVQIESNFADYFRFSWLGGHEFRGDNFKTRDALCKATFGSDWEYPFLKDSSSLVLGGDHASQGNCAACKVGSQGLESSGSYLIVRHKCIRNAANLAY